jgi:hypothetical protein
MLRNQDGSRHTADCDRDVPAAKFDKSLPKILTYPRDDDFSAYLDDLGNCLTAPDVRFHIKKLMLSVVGQVSDPKLGEWAAIKGQLQEWPEKSGNHVRDAIWTSAPWFRFLHEQGVLSSWLTSDRPETSRERACRRAR